MRNNNQGIRVKSVEHFFSQINDEELKIVDILREIILETIPDCEERISYNVPFYRRYKTICYLWPGTVLWGKKQSYEGVHLGFYQGHLLSDPYQILIKTNRKQVYYLLFEKKDNINQNIIRQYLHEAVIIDEALRK